MAKKRFAWSVGLAIGTLILLGVAETNLPYSPARDRAVDAFAMPGAWIAGLVYPQGIHTGNGARYWGIAVFSSNFMVYTVFWYACLRLAGYVLARNRGTAR